MAPHSVDDLRGTRATVAKLRKADLNGLHFVSARALHEFEVPAT